MKDYRYRREQTRNGITGAAVIGLLAVVVVVGPHLLRTSPTTNGSTDPANGVRTTAVARAAPRCDNAGPPAEMSLHGYLHLAAASLCVPPRPRGRATSGSALPLSPVELRELEADFNAHSTSSPRVHGACATARRSISLSGVTVDGHRVVLFADGCTGEFAGIGRYWLPSAATRATFDAMVRTSRQRRP